MSSNRTPSTRFSPKPVRCAIYTRVSTDQGLDQEFNSLDAQREASEAYIKSQAHEGWTCLKQAYDDGGYSGVNSPEFPRHPAGSVFAFPIPGPDCT